MSRWRKFSVWAVLSSALVVGALSGMGGCNESKLQKADQAAKDINKVAQLGRSVADSPAGAVIPQAIREILELLGLGGTLAYGIWQKIRASGILAKSNDKSITLTAIADAIDTMPSGQAQPVKDQIKQVMQDREILSTANAVVDEHRSKLVA